MLDEFKTLLKDAVKRIGVKSAAKSVLGIDIGASSIKIVQLKRERGAAVLETYGEIALAPYAGLDAGQAARVPYEKLIEALEDVLRESNTTTRDCGISIPMASSLTTIAEFPKLPEEQLKEMVPIEARKYIPVPLNEVMFDWFVIPERPEDGGESTVTKVLLVAIHNDVLSTYRQLVTDASLDVKFFEIEMFSAARAVLDRGVAPVLVIDVGAATSKLYIIERGVIRASHSLKKGGQDITRNLARASGISYTQAEEEKREKGMNAGVTDTGGVTMLTTDYIVSEAHRVVLQYQKKYNTNVGQVVLTGGGSLMPGFAEYVESQLHAEVTIADPFDKTETPAFLVETLRSAGPIFSVAVGLALRRLQEAS